MRRYDGKIVPTQDPAGRELFWFTVTPIEGADEGTDRWAIEQSWISLTPLRLDLTDGHALEEARVRRPLDEVLAAAVSPGKSSPQAAQSVREDEAPAAIPKARWPAGRRAYRSSTTRSRRRASATYIFCRAKNESTSCWARCFA